MPWHVRLSVFGDVNDCDSDKGNAWILAVEEFGKLEQAILIVIMETFALSTM
jgi:hypothetical protein